MNVLSDREWKTKYTPDDGDLVKLFYVPVLECAVRYDRTTGYFAASALALVVASGIAVFAGSLLSQSLNEKLVGRVAGSIFILVGIWTIVRS